MNKIKKLNSKIKILTISILILIEIIFILKDIITIKRIKPLSTLKEKSQINYKVYIQKNDFYEEDYLDKDKLYLSDLINYININFNYSLNKKINYNYLVTATIKSNYKSTDLNNSKELWHKTYLLKTKNNNTSNKIVENININYNYYNDLVNKLKDKFNIGLDSYLLINLNVESSQLKESPILEVTIPLAKPTTSITTKYDKEKTTNILNTVKIESLKENVKLEIVFLLITIIILIIILKNIYLKAPNIYVKTLTKILKEYKEIIIEVENPPDFNELTLLSLKEFSDLIDIEEELKQPIIYYETKKYKESWFIIITDKYLYRYILN